MQVSQGVQLRTSHDARPLQPRAFRGIFKLGGVFGGSPDPGLAALALIDPARAATAIEKQFDAGHADYAARAELAELLVLEGDALWRKLYDILGLWSIDVEDIF